MIAAANVARNDIEKAGFNFQNHILFSAQDIEETVALMCYIQLSLLGVAGFVKVGNSLTDPIRMVTLWRTTGLRPCTLAMFGILVELSVK